MINEYSCSSCGDIFNSEEIELVSDFDSKIIWRCPTCGSRQQIYDDTLIKYKY